MTEPASGGLMWFSDHDRIESVLFDGGLDPALCEVTPPSAAGHGMSQRQVADSRYRIA